MASFSGLIAIRSISPRRTPMSRSMRSESPSRWAAVGAQTHLPHRAEYLRSELWSELTAARVPRKQHIASMPGQAHASAAGSVNIRSSTKVSGEMKRCTGRLWSHGNDL